MRKIILAVAAILAGGFAFAQPVQKWVDDKGRVHYGTPPPGGGPFSEQARKDFSREIEGGIKDGDTRHPLRKAKER